MSFYPFENPIGFGAADFIALAVAILLIAAAYLREPIVGATHRLAKNPAASMAILAALPILLRLALLAHHPVPSPNIYDEFGHLLAADTLRHFRFSNPSHPLHEFFETFFVLQQPTYSSIYPIGQGFVLAIGRAISGSPWTGVLLSTAAFCALSYWMLRWWVSPPWAFFGGLLAVIQFGPLCYWTNSYWGGSLAAAAGCLVFGALPRAMNWKTGLALGAGLSFAVLIRPYESIFVFAAAAVYFIFHRPSRAVIFAFLPLLGTAAIMLVQNRSITGEWTTLPYTLSRFQYGVPASLTIQPDSVPHRELTPQQSMEYKSQLAFKGTAQETFKTYLLRLEYRVRFYRFFFLPPLYVACIFFFVPPMGRRFVRVAATILLFALGANFYPLFEFHYFAPIAALLLLVAVKGLENLALRSTNAALAVVVLCCFPFLFWYGVHLFDDGAVDVRQYESWAGINHTNPERRIAVRDQLQRVPGDLLVIVRYSPSHIFQDEWVYNEADIDHARIVWARDLGAERNRRLLDYYPRRKVFLLEPDFRPPRLSAY